LFSIQFVPADYYVNSNTITNGAWEINTGSVANGDTCTSDSDFVSQYAFYEFTVPSSGLYDINVAFVNYTEVEDFVASLFKIGTLSFIGTGNLTDGVDPCGCSNCAANWVATIDEDDGLLNWNDDAGEAGIFPTVSLLTGTTYTVLMQTDDIEFTGAWGVTVRPTVYQTIGQATNYVDPIFDDCDEAPIVCTPDTGNLYNWRAFVFTALYQTYLIQVGETSLPSDNELDEGQLNLYFGNNAGSSDQTTPPASCPVSGNVFIQCGEEDGNPVAYSGFVVGQNYTVVVTDIDSEFNSPNATFTLLIYGGTQVGVIGSSTTGFSSATTGSPVVTTGKASTTGFSSATTASPVVTTGIASSTTAAASGTTGSHTSGTSYVFPSLVLGMIALWLSM